MGGRLAPGRGRVRLLGIVPLLGRVGGPGLRLVRGEGGGIRLDLGFAYTAGSAVDVVPAGAGGSVPRDTKGEQVLLAGVEALAAVLTELAGTGLAGERP